MASSARSRYTGERLSGPTEGEEQTGLWSEARRRFGSCHRTMFTNPKRTKGKASNKEAWFDYYAGFSAAFVRTVLERLLPHREGRVLDPWNGSGTTTTTAHELGVRSTGLDINPVMVVVAMVKLLVSGV